MERIWAGRLIALLYLFCVLAPSAALAFGSGPLPCLDEVHVTVVHDAAMTDTHRHILDASHTVSLHQHGALANAPGHEQHHRHRTAVPGPCCALMCASAMPAELPSLVMPPSPVSTCAGEVYRSLHGEAPARLYRPPIA